MPGIAGVIFKSGLDAYGQEHASMLDVMRHESSYSVGTYVADRLNVRVGWIGHANSFCERMPVANERGDLVLVLYGEDFSRTADSDARYLLRLYEELGESFLLELNGWFSGVLVDLRQRKVLLFNDRYGMQKLYYRETRDALFFSSEAKSLLQVLPAARSIDADALAEYIAFDCVLDDKSLFEGVSAMPAASCWTFDETGRSRKSRYFSPETLETGPQARESDITDRLEKILVDVLPRYFRAPSPLAISLTGGLDTRLILAAAQDASGLESYTFAGSRDTFDVRQSRRVAQAAAMNHHVIRLERDFFANFPKLAEATVYISDGALGVEGAHNLYLNRLAREIAPVRLTGLFGSEVLRQGRILPHAEDVSGMLSPDFLSHVGRAEQRVEAHRGGNPLTAAVERDIPWRTHGSVSIERSQVLLRSPFMDNDLVEFLYTIPNTLRQSKTLQLELIRRLNVKLGRIVSDHGDAIGRNPLLLCVTRLFLWTLFKADYIYFFDTPNWLVKLETAMGFLKIPNLFFGYQKFENYRVWYRDVFREYVADILLDSRTLDRPYFNRTFLRKAVEDHLAGRKNYRTHLDRALTLELIMRTLVESKVPTPYSRPVEPATMPG